MKNVIICCPDNGAGLSSDFNIVAKLLTDHGYSISRGSATHPTVTYGWYDLAIHMEILNRNNLQLAKKNILIPNPEWFYLNWVGLLDKIDLVICKTKDTQNIFEKLRCKTVFSAFTSQDKYLPDVARQRSFVHLPGKSKSKATDLIMKAFAEPGMPDLTVYQHRSKFPPHIPDRRNIHYHFRRLEDNEHRIVQNKYLFHLCPSIYEGWGHYINEAKSCGAIVITTNGSPMNEHIIPDKCGIGLGVTTIGQMRLAITKHTSAEKICKAVSLLVSQPDHVLETISKRARESFLQTDSLFRKKFIDIIDAVNGTT